MSNAKPPLNDLEERRPEGRLDSWKEIAAYLKRGISTVQRWERQEGLPVHRHLHDKLGSVYAHRSELDAWLASRKPLPTDDSQSDVEADVIEGANSTTTQVTGPRQWQVRMFALAGLLLVGLAVGIYWGRARFWPSANTPPGRVMVAVLPFKNLSGNPAEEPLADGMTEQMIGQLGRLDAQRLGVIARTTAMRYKETSKGIEQIREELGVSYLLEGGVLREGNRVRINAQLVRASDKATLWAESYERELASVVVVQDEIARRIARSLMIQLVPSGRASITTKSKTFPEAYDSFVRGHYFFNKATPDGLLKSRDLFEAAIKIDPGFALAYAGLADSYNLLGSYGVLPPQEAFTKAKEAATKALELDDQLVEAHNALALTTFYYEWDWATAEREFQRAIALDPNYAKAYHWYAWYLSLMGRHTEALKEVKQAMELDPFSPQLIVDVGSFYLRARRYDQAIAQYKKALELEPDFAGARTGLLEVYLVKGMYPEALAEFESGLMRAGRRPRGAPALRQTDPVASVREILRWQLLRLREQSKRTYVAPSLIAQFYVVLGEKDLALEWLEKAFQEHSHAVVFLKVDPIYDPLRSDPRFGQLLRRAGWPD